MGFEKIAEQKIREAMKEGQFDRLPRAGSPIDLDEYFKLPEDLRMAYSILKSANCLPEEVELLNEIADLERRLAAAAGDEARRDLASALEQRRLRLALALERRRRK